MSRCFLTYPISVGWIRPVIIRPTGRSFQKTRNYRLFAPVPGFGLPLPQNAGRVSTHMRPDSETPSTQPDRDLLLADLKRQISDRNVVIVVGAGVSVAATEGNPIATWSGLLHDGVCRCEAVVPALTPGWGDRVRMEIDSGDIDDRLSAAEKVTSKLSNQAGEFGRWLRETIGVLRASDTTLIRSLTKLDLPLATTNYD